MGEDDPTLNFEPAKETILDWKQIIREAVREEFGADIAAIKSDVAEIKQTVHRLDEIERTTR